jgi:hypothetical protein
MAQVGRISGPVLKSNLIRNGVDLAFETDLLYLDVNENRIGINTDSPSKTLQVFDSIGSNNLIAEKFDTPQFTVQNNEIKNNIGNIKLNAQNAVRLGGLDNDTLFLKDNFISATVENQSIIIDPSGVGTVEFESDTNVFGNLSTPNKLRLDGTINFGDADTDSLDFNADLNSDFIPDQTNTVSLGKPTKRWANTFTKLLNGEEVTTTSLTAGQIDFNLRQGNIFYVAKNGDDKNFGDHPLAPFRTIKAALAASDASIQGPVSIYVFPGEYDEQFPLEVPNNVSVVGTDIRSVIIKPTNDTAYSDVFLLDGDTTIENLTIKDFYYDDNKGYAFRFKPGTIIQSRSPYIRNVSVITKGTVNNAEDPKGYHSGDAGRGAWIDGTEVDAASQSASMLFQSCTFITPGVDAITMTNGVRVEWLSCFTYFANRGLYAFNNSTGRIAEDGSTVRFGAEIRSVSSANVYGNIGVEADGEDCLMYLIQHNFAYVGSGKNISNDKTKSNQQHEVIELNNGKIRFTSIDHLGTYRVGDYFFADFEKGTTSISNANLSADELSNLRIENNGNETFFTFNSYLTGNIQVSNNLIKSFVGPVNINAPEKIELQKNTKIDNNLDITGNFLSNGDFNLLGSAINTSISFLSTIDSDLNLNQDSIFNLGNTSKRWRSAAVDKIQLPSALIVNNTIASDDSNSSLEFKANSAGNVRVENLDFGDKLLSNFGDLFLLSDTGFVTVSSKALKIPTGTTEQIIIQPTDSDSLGNIRFNNEIGVFEGFQNATVTFNGVYSDDRQTTMLVDSDYAQNSILLTVNSELISEIDSSGVNTNSLQIDDVAIDNNIIRTNVSNADLEIEPNNVGETRIGNFSIIDNKIKNLASDNKLSFAITGLGYQKITGSNGFVVPSGTESQRPTTPEIGETRWNTDQKILEVWDGSVFLDASGAAQFVNEDEFNDLILEYSLMFG